jgi:CheY-like chemotaxis protein
MKEKPRILMVDDDEDYIEVMKKVFKSKPWEIIVASNGDEGIQKAKQEKPTLILLDLMMPIKDGWITAKELAQDPQTSKIPVLALTSFSEDLGQPFEIVVAEYITKAVPPNELIKKIEEHLKKLGF